MPLSSHLIGESFGSMRIGFGLCAISVVLEGRIMGEKRCCGNALFSMRAPSSSDCVSVSESDTRSLQSKSMSVPLGMSSAMSSG